MKKILVLFTFLVTNAVFSQDNFTKKKLDSIETKLSKVSNDSIRLTMMLGLGRDYALHANKRNLEFNQKSIELAQKLNRPLGIAEAYANYGLYYERINDTLKQKEYLEKILVLGQEKKDNRVLGKAYFEKGFYYWNRKNLRKTNQYLEQSIEFYKKTKDKNSLSEVYLQIGFLHQEEFKDYNKALFYYRKHIDLFDKDDFQLINTYSTIASIYTMQSKYQKALEYYMLSDKLFKKHKATNSFHYALLQSKLATVYQELEEYDKSLKYLNFSLKYFLSKQDYRASSVLYAQQAALYLKMKDSKNTLKSIESAAEISEKIENCVQKENAYSAIAYIFYDMKNYAKALEFHLKSYKECPQNTPYKDLETQEFNIGATYLMLAKNLDQITNTTAAVPKNKNGLLQLGENYLTRVMESAKINSNISLLNNCYLHLSEIADLQNDKRKALDYYKQHIIYKDSLATIENRELLVQNQMQFEFDQQEKVRVAEQEAKDALSREELTKEKNNRNLALGGIGFFVVVAGFSAFAYVQKRKDNKIISEEKQKSDDLLLNILPAEIAQELKEKGTSEAKHFESVSIMFTDFKDFTKLSEKIPSTELIQELNYCFKEFDNIITKHGVEKIKTIGDSYMAVCGLPAKYGNHAQKMVDAALEIRDFIEKYKEKRQEEGKSFFEMRIGINSGEVVAGIVGIKKFAYDIWGDAVNTASRMESNGEIGKVNISEATYNLVKNDFSFDYRGEMDAKGKGKIKMYFVEPKENNV
jgi:class 3 adenylate cyclase/tetratricopeptide (TPR) repeat protein